MKLHKSTKSLSMCSNSWSIISLVLIILLVIPILYIASGMFRPTTDTFTHVSKTLLKVYTSNTFIIGISTGILTSVLGVSAAWLIAAYNFPGRNFFSWGLILPLSIPTYIGGFVYSGIFSYTGNGTYLLNKIGYSKRLDIMNIWGVIFIFTILLYPYVYLISKSYFSNQSASMVEASKALGKNNTETFFKVVLPLSRGAVVGGMTLVIFEVLNSYGLVSYFGVPTFSTGIFRTWLSMGDSDGAIKLSGILILFTFGIITIEKILRGRRSYSYSSTKIRPLKREKLIGFKKWTALIYCSVILSISFIIPLMQLLQWGYLSFRNFDYLELLIVIRNSFTITLAASVIIIIVAVIVANSIRLSHGTYSQLMSKLATTGYSIPGSVIAIGVLFFFVFLDKKFIPVYRFFNIDKTLVLSGSYVVLLFAYMVRFLAVAFNSIESGFDKIGKKFHEASRSLGLGITKTFFKVDLPMIKNSILGALIFVFIEIIKELPLTLILRPFNFNTLATLTQQYAEDEMLQESSIPALIIISACFLAIVYFSKILGKKRR